MRAMESPVEPYYARLRRLRRERGLSRSNLLRLTGHIGIDTLIALEQTPEPDRPQGSGKSRYPSAETLEDIAQALGVEPEEFPEYRLAKAREELDDRIVGLDRALATLSALQAAQRQRADQGLAAAAAPPSRSRRRQRATGTAGPSHREDGRREP